MSKQGVNIVLNGRNQIRLDQVEKQIINIGRKVATFCCDIANQD